MHLSAGSSPVCAAHDAANVCRYMSWSLFISLVLVDMDGIWPRSSGSPGSAAIIPAMPPNTGAILRGGLYLSVVTSNDSGIGDLRRKIGLALSLSHKNPNLLLS